MLAVNYASDEEYIYMKNDSFFNYSDTEVFNPYKKSGVSGILLKGGAALLIMWI